MVIFPDRAPQPNSVGAAWLAVIRSDTRMADEAKTLVVAAEIARLVQGEGCGELPSPCDLARLAKLTEDDAVDAVNQLILRGFIAIIFRPYLRHSLKFFVRPSAYQTSMLQKKPVT